ncbi:MAG: ATP-dependent DNA helicase RecG [Acholeplasmatales bacterium]|nr:ATP-dependent DNA helicase RecG [Acholeplasmatales bacterium]
MKLTDIKGVGKKSLEALNDDNIYTVDDLIHTFPASYTIYEINNDLAFSGEYVSITGTLTSAPYFLKYKKNVNSILFYIYINNIKLKCIMFSNDYLRYKLFKDTRVTLYGKYKIDTKEFLVRSIFFDAFENKIAISYKLKHTKDNIISKAINYLYINNYRLNETLPLELLDKYKLYDINKYIYALHLPNNKEEYRQVIRRRKYEDFFWYALSLELLKATRKDSSKRKREINVDIINLFMKTVKYPLTEDQKKAIYDIYNDILNDYPMNRLIQGDVGCGKSIVSLIASLMLISAGYQVAVMVPTEMLAIQQYESFKESLSGFGLQIELLTSNIKKSVKDDILYRLENNRVQLIVGTHSLIEDNVRFAKLGLVVIDEQHKFGVNQRQRLVKKYNNVDCLYLTATPIPRTLGLTEFGDLDITSIKTMPIGRKVVKTRLGSFKKIKSLAEFINTHILYNEQAYIVVPLVEDNDELAAVSINEAYDIFKDLLPNAKIGIAHGKQSAIDRNNIMSDFKNGRIDILLSTTVIEVGVNVPNATIMVILNAERFGMAQIHQLRGRVGRSASQAYCFLISDDTNNERLLALEEMSDGFDIANKDFEIRGPGQYFGENQSGHFEIGIADFNADLNIWRCAKEDAKKYLNKFLNKEIYSSKFNEIIDINKQQNGKIN